MGSKIADAAAISSSKRREDKATIVLVGLSGAGKSSTINSLFDWGGKTDDDCFQSATQSILEYQVEVVTPLGSSAKKVAVIDTPGLGDTCSEEPFQKDSQILATLENFLLKHPELGGHYPTAVLLVIDFTDPRLFEERSHFIHLLLAIEYLSRRSILIDKDPRTCNLIIVATHFMNASKELVAYPERQIRQITGLVKTYTTLTGDVPIVLAENKGNDFKLKRAEGGYELPNGEKFPLNLFKALIETSRMDGDESVGQIFIDTLAAGKPLRKRLIREDTLISATSVDALRYLNVLQNTQIRDSSNEMARLLDEEWNGLPPHETGNHGIALAITKRVFSRAGITSQSKLPQAANETVQLLLQLPVCVALEKTLENIGLIAPSLLNCCKSVGYFYNTNDDLITNKTPFNTNKVAITHIGFKAPIFMSADVITSESFRKLALLERYNSKQEYIGSRLKLLHLDDEDSSSENFVAEPKPGHNIIQNNTTMHGISGIREYREYSVSLTAKPKFDFSYVRAVEDLGPYGRKTAQKWANHFAANGTHVIKSAFLGGWIVVTASRKENVQDGAEVGDILEVVKCILDDPFDAANHNRLAASAGWKFELSLHGGETNMRKPKLDDLNSETGRQAFDLWKESIKMHPILLPTEIHLEHISASLKTINDDVSRRVSHAARCSLGYKEYADVQRSMYNRLADKLPLTKLALAILIVLVLAGSRNGEIAIVILAFTYLIYKFNLI